MLSSVRPSVTVRALRFPVAPVLGGMDTEDEQQSTRRRGWRAVVVAFMAMIAAPAATASAGLPFATGGWEWASTTTQSSSIADIEFAGSLGYAAGANGTLLRSVDGGDSWAAAPTPAPGSLLDNLELFGDSTVFVSAEDPSGRTSVLRSDDRGQTFRHFPPLTGRATIDRVDVVDTQTIVLVDVDERIWISTDGGSSSSRRGTIPDLGADHNFAGLRFTSPTTGIVVDATGKIYWTGDAGKTWTTAYTGKTELSGAHFADTQIGYAAGERGTILRTDDGGRTWATRPTAADGDWLSTPACASPEHCAFRTSTRVLRTTDGGQSTTLSAPLPERLSALAFVSADRLAGFDRHGSPVLSRDGGATFATLGTRVLPEGLNSVWSSEASGVLAATDEKGGLYVSSDAGKTWSGGVVAPSQLSSVTFPSRTVGFALVKGDPWRSMDGGRTWAKLSDRRATSLVALSDRTVLLADRGIRRSTDGGRRFTAVRSAAVTRAKPSWLDHGSARTVFSGADQSLIRSDDGGRSWRRVRWRRTVKGKRARMDPESTISQVQFVDRSHGFMLEDLGSDGDSGRGEQLWRTENGGRTWTPMRDHGIPHVVRSIEFISGNEGYIFSDAGQTGDDFNRLREVIWRTADGGRSFTPQYSPGRIDHAAALSGGRALILDEDGRVLVTTTGGNAGTPSTVSITKVTKPKAMDKRGSRYEVTVTGRLRPSVGGETVVLSVGNGSEFPGWRNVSVTVATDGTFSQVFKLNSHEDPLTIENRLLAQWFGNARLAGDGSRVRTVAVPRRR